MANDIRFLLEVHLIRSREPRYRWRSSELRGSLRTFQRFGLGLVILDELPDREIEHHILGSAGDAGRGDVSVDTCSPSRFPVSTDRSPRSQEEKKKKGSFRKTPTFSNLPPPRCRKPITTKQQNRTPRTLIQHPPRLRLRQRRQPPQLPIRLHLPQPRHLKHKLLDPRALTLQQRPRGRKPMPHDRLLHERFPKRLAVEAVRESGSEGDAGLAGGADGDAEAFVVEVGHDVCHAAAFVADEVFGGDAHVVEGDEGGSGCLPAGGFDLAHRDAWMVEEGHDEEGEAGGAGAGGADGHGGVGGPDAISDPFLGTVDNVEFPVWGLGGCGLDPSDVGAGFWFGDGDADPFLTEQEIGEEAFLKLRATEFQDGRYAVRHPSCQRGRWPLETGPAHLYLIAT